MYVLKLSNIGKNAKNILSVTFCEWLYIRVLNIAWALSKVFYIIKTNFNFCLPSFPTLEYKFWNNILVNPFIFFLQNVNIFIMYHFRTYVLKVWYLGSYNPTHP
jgi:hypothetical protein